MKKSTPFLGLFAIVFAVSSMIASCSKTDENKKASSIESISTSPELAKEIMSHPFAVDAPVLPEMNRPGHGHQPASADTCQSPGNVQAHAISHNGQDLCDVSWPYMDSINVFRLKTVFPDGSVHYQTLTTGNYLDDTHITYTPNGYFPAPDGSSFQVQAFCLKTLNVNWYDYVNLIPDTTLYSVYSFPVRTIHY